MPHVLGQDKSLRAFPFNKGILLPLRFCIWNSQRGLDRVVPAAIYLGGKNLWGMRDP